MKLLFPAVFLLCFAVLFSGCGSSGSTKSGWNRKLPEGSGYTISGGVALAEGGLDADLTQATVYLYPLYGCECEDECGCDEIGCYCEYYGEYEKYEPLYRTNPNSQGNYGIPGVSTGNYLIIVTGLPGYSDAYMPVQVIDSAVAVEVITLLP